ncbi:hypothetical protein [Actinokineospora enzanensis]|uniref:hypothetical protein n=1 Tax=Actinokineospora enzanensis TaxID=155975 RepID=UPI0012EC84B4|nr:hypothetical protein [Actinokineospora enzanensis]
MADNDEFVDPGTEYTWLVETSDDGADWWQELHPVHGSRESGGMEFARNAEELAAAVLGRRFAALHGDEIYDWEELWFRVTVWNHRAVSDWAGPHQPPYGLEQARTTPQTHGMYLKANKAEPHAVEVRVPRQVRDGVWKAHVKAAASGAATSR